MMKKEYVKPAMEVFSLATIQETMGSSSKTGTGADTTMLGEDSFDDIFNS